jgi:hypothetical protein
MKEIIILSCDPGTKNFAVSITAVRLVKGTIKFRILGTKVISSTVRELKANIVMSIKGFVDEILELLDKEKVYPDVLYMERFQSRGNGGTTIEAINFMLGVLVYHFNECDIRLLTAATWKNRVNAKTDLKEVYKSYGLNRVASLKTAHELDAALIGIYAAHQYFDREDYSCFDEPGSFENFMDYFLSRKEL